MTNPRCKYFGKCGGCSAQHIDYSIQLENKKNVISHIVKDVEIQAFSDDEYNYRNRMDFIFTPEGLGFREKGKWFKTVNLELCEIADERLNKLMQEVKDFFKGIDAFHIKRKIGTFRFAVIRTPKNDSSICITLNADSMKLGDAVTKIKEFAKVTTAENVLVTYVPQNTDVSMGEESFVVKGKDMLHEEYLDKKFWYSAFGFFQNNTKMAEKMHEYCNGLLKEYETEGKHLLDLYGGVGTFGIINSSLFKGITVIEDFEGSIKAAKKNMKENEVENGDAMVLDAKQLHKVKLPKELFVITDPPRCGMHPKAIKQLIELNPEVIIYVSCNPKQLAKELPLFRDYKVKSAAMFDLFPHTPHSEAVIELVHK